MSRFLTKRNLILAGLGLIFIFIGLVFWLIQANISQPGSSNTTPTPESKTNPTPTAFLPSPTAVPSSPTPRPTTTPLTLSVSLNPQHGIHAPVGGQWTEPQRQALAAFQNAAGEKAAPGLVVALNADLTAANNPEKVRMEEDLFRYQEFYGTQVYIRMYPQRFPGGLTEPLESSNGRNTISGTPEDAAEDLYRFLQEQQRRTGRHFTRLIPGNEPNLEWPNANYFYNVLAWQSNNDPAKYDAINTYFVNVYNAWQRRLERPDAALFRDVRLYFPAIAQDGHPNYFGGAYFYDSDQPVANKYDRLRPAIELFGRFSWHNYFRPGRAWDDRAVTAFPDWLKQGLANSWPYAITEAGWTPDALALPTQRDGPAFIARLWQRLNWSKELARDPRPQWQTQDETLSGFSFEDDIEYFISVCAGASDDKTLPPLKPGVAVWLAGSEGNFVEAIGVEPGSNGAIRRWFSRYAAWKF